ncbi:MAG: tRNA (guanine(46)-N(7))-methyltransferase TrmB [Alphaproteobacteria bacterium]|nr:tRNA (guanine(46)-N(7))-methyltransferase TrmB [Alphaproteobacteria bacterium]
MKNTEKSFVIRTFGRTHGKKLSAHQADLVENLLPKLSPLPGDAQDTQILEIGFGAGEHLLHLAEWHPDAGIIGAEPFMNGVASLLSHMTCECSKCKVQSSILDLIKPEYRNIRIWPDDVRKLFELCTLNFNKIYILHPDPWPKSRHEKRRLLYAEFLNELAAHLDANGEIIIGTDHGDYFEWVLEQIKKSNLKIINKDFTTPPESGLTTRYKNKDMFGRNLTQYLVLTR